MSAADKFCLPFSTTPLADGRVLAMGRVHQVRHDSGLICTDLDGWHCWLEPRPERGHELRAWLHDRTGPKDTTAVVIERQGERYVGVDMRRPDIVAPVEVAPEPPDMRDEPMAVLLFPSSLLLNDAGTTFRPGEQIGRPFRVRWSEFVEQLKKSPVPDVTKWPDPKIRKASRGGWTAGLYRDHHRKGSHLIETELMTIDIDAHGDVERAASALARYRAFVHSTYNSTRDNPRCRVVLKLKEPCTDPKTYKRGHEIMRGQLIAWGFERTDIDDGASDCSRLNYLPCHQEGQEPSFVEVKGEPLDLKRLVDANPLRKSTTASTPTPMGTKPPAYKAVALRNETERMRSAKAGERHTTLFRCAARLARVDLGATDKEIRDALEVPYMRVADGGDDEDREFERTLRDAIAAGRSGT